MRTIDILALVGAIGYAEVKAITVHSNYNRNPSAEKPMELIAIDPDIIQNQVEFICDGSLQRLQRESKGNIVWSSGNFTDVSFPANTKSLSWTTDYST